MEYVALVQDAIARTRAHPPEAYVQKVSVVVDADASYIRLIRRKREGHGMHSERDCQDRVWWNEDFLQIDELQPYIANSVVTLVAERKHQ